jgi:glycosyltransferase involved in cell wall biosynthesis
MFSVLLLADAASSHTQKWALALAKQGVRVGLFSFNRSSIDWFSDHENIEMLFQPKSKKTTLSIFTKLTYLTYIPQLKKAIGRFAPDVVHAHYATSYGLVGRVARFHPFVISAWGTDVMKFPEQRFLNKKLLINNLESADLICATSGTIKNYIHKITDKYVHIIPFGVDCNQFIPNPRKKDEIVVACIKSLEHVYRIDLLINAFKIAVENCPDKSLRLLIVGGGSLENYLKELCKQLHIEDQVDFLGRLSHDEVVKHYQCADVFCNLSDYESFGVSILEAMACEVPVVATATGGARDIIVSQELGRLVPVNSVTAAADALIELIKDEDLRRVMAKNARAHVIKNYNWNDNVDEMIAQYKKLVHD